MLKVAEESQEDADSISMASDESGSMVDSDDSDTSIHRLRESTVSVGDKSRKSRQSRRSKSRRSRQIRTANASMISNTSISKMSDLDGTLDQSNLFHDNLSDIKDTMNLRQKRGSVKNKNSI